MKYVYQGASSRGSKTIQVSNFPSLNAGIMSELKGFVVVVVVVVVLTAHIINKTRTNKSGKVFR